MSTKSNQSSSLQQQQQQQNSPSIPTETTKAIFSNTMFSQTQPSFGTKVDYPQALAFNAPSSSHTIHYPQQYSQIHQQYQQYQQLQQPLFPLQGSGSQAQAQTQVQTQTQAQAQVQTQAPASNNLYNAQFYHNDNYLLQGSPALQLNPSYGQFPSAVAPSQTTQHNDIGLQPLQSTSSISIERPYAMTSITLDQTANSMHSLPPIVPFQGLASILHPQQQQLQLQQQLQQEHNQYQMTKHSNSSPSIPVAYYSRGIDGQYSNIYDSTRYSASTTHNTNTMGGNGGVNLTNDGGFEPKKNRKRRQATSTLHSMTPETAERNRCRLCGKQFRRPSSLQTHYYSHTGEKIFKCPWKECGKLFSVKSNMTRHYKLHERDLQRAHEFKLQSQNPQLMNHLEVHSNTPNRGVAGTNTAGNAVSTGSDIAVGGLLHSYPLQQQIQHQHQHHQQNQQQQQQQQHHLYPSYAQIQNPTGHSLDNVQQRNSLP